MLEQTSQILRLLTSEVERNNGCSWTQFTDNFDTVAEPPVRLCNESFDPENLVQNFYIRDFTSGASDYKGVSTTWILVVRKAATIKATLSS